MAALLDVVTAREGRQPGFDRLRVRNTAALTEAAVVTAGRYEAARKRYPIRAPEQARMVHTGWSLQPMRHDPGDVYHPEYATMQPRVEDEDEDGPPPPPPVHRSRRAQQPACS